MRHSTISVGGAGTVRRSSAARRPLEWCRGHATWLVAVVFFTAMYWPFMRKGEDGEWRKCFLRAAQRLQSGQIIHRLYEPNTYAYPPAMAMFAVPLAGIPFRWSLTAWYAVNVVAMATAVVYSWRLIGGPALADLARSWSHVFWLGLFLGSRFLVAPLENQQFDVVITACLLAGCMALSRGKDTAAALWLGTATAMKCTPLLFAPYLIWRRKIGAAALLVLVAVALNRLPDFLWPKVDGGSYLADWVGTFLVKVGRSAPGVWESDLILNQSLSGLLNRLVQAGLPLTTSDLPSALTRLSPETSLAIRLLTYGFSIALVGMTAWSFGAPAAMVDVDQGNRANGWSSIRTAIEASAVVCLMLLLSPMSSKAHYVVLVLPCMLLARAVVEKHLRGMAWVPLLLLFGPLTAKGITGKALGDLLLAWGLPTWFTIVALVAVWRLLAMLKSPPRQPLYSALPSLHTTSLHVGR
ncbi:MAG TPA: glycosyltransferase family 87 protein [Pirellulales bacterium]|nr:glycosyltransferase family 87 protein [Pirellulales bacterium]